MHVVIRDTSALFAVITGWLGVLFHLLPVIAATAASICAVIYYILQILESPRVKRWLEARKARRDQLNVDND
jgi:hypothetical protein